jgi:hypothetical protein
MSVGAISSRFPVAVFLTLILLPTILFGVDGPWIGEDVPFQPRAAFPQRFSQRLFKEFGRWFGDRIGLRYPLIYAAVGYDVLLLRWPIDRYVVFGREGWLFFADSIDGDKNSLADFRGRLRFRPSEITRINAGLEAIRKRLEACGITFLVVLVPNKQSIYGSYLGSDETGVSTRIDDLLSHLDESVRSIIVDLRGPLRTASDTYAPRLVYNKTDTHWNALGAFQAYQAILTELARRIRVPSLDLADLDRFDVMQRRSTGGDMGRSLLAPSRFPDTEISLIPKAPIPQVEADPQHTVFRATVDASAGPLVIFGDSFAASLAEPLARHFGKVYSRGPSVDGAIIAETGSKVVLLELVARQAGRLLGPFPNTEHACRQ